VYARTRARVRACGCTGGDVKHRFNCVIRTPLTYRNEGYKAARNPIDDSETCKRALD
jgi:hypothetical protein